MTSYALGPFALDSRTRVLTRDGEVERLHLKTVEVLLALVERRGEIVTKDELLARAWPDAVVEEANLSVHVSLIRKTLGQAAPIETIPKRGYRLLASSEPSPPSGPASPARDHVLRGRHFWNKLTRVGLERADAAFSAAIEADPACGEAQAGLADTRLMQGLFGFEPSREVFARARRHAEAAARLSPGSPEALASLAFTAVFDAWDLESPVRALERARALAPARAEPHLWSALLHALRGEALRAGAEARAARDIDPLSLKGGVGLGFHLYLSQQLEPDEGPLLQILDLEPDYAVGHWALGLARDRRGRLGEAEACHRAAVVLSGGSPTMESNLARSLALAGRHDEAREIRDRLAAASLAHYRLATIDLALGEAASALRHLEAALSERDPWLVLARVDPMLDPLRKEPAFRRLERAVFGA